jgi:transposase
MLDRIDTATAMQVRLDARIEARIEPYRRHIELLATIPGVSATTAQLILPEIGADITQFPCAGHLASWAGICPGNHESAGKHTSGTTRPGDPWLKGVLGRAAISAARGKDTSGDFHARVDAARGAVGVRQSAHVRAPQRRRRRERDGRTARRIDALPSGHGCQMVTSNDQKLWMSLGGAA